LAATEEIDGMRVDRLLFLATRWRDLKRGRVDLWAASLYYSPATQRRLQRLLDEFQPQVVNIHYPESQTPFLQRHLASSRFKVVASLHGFEVERWFATGHLVTSLDPDFLALRNLLRRADVVTACSKHLLQQAIQIEPEIEAKGYVTYNGVDLDRFKSRVCYSHPRPYILAYGRLSHQKGFDLLIRAFATTTSADSEIDLIIAGEGEDAGLLKQLVGELGLGTKVIFLGRATGEQVVQLLNGALFVVISSRWEPFGIVALEAMAAGKRIVATRVGGLTEFVEGTVNRLVPPTVEGIAEGIRESLGWNGNEDGADRLNREQAARFTWDAAVERYLTVYEGASN
jgi:glycosyltransferase involved in cell wall biosynthesis